MTRRRKIIFFRGHKPRPIAKRAGGRRFPSAIALAALLTIPALAGSQSGVRASRAATDAQTLYVANYEWDGNLDPHVQYGQVAPVIFRNCYDSLIRLKGTSPSEYVGDLATSWSANAAKTVW